LIHNPLLETFQIGATVRRVAESKVKGEEQGIANGMWAGAFGLIEEVPFMRETGEVSKLSSPTKRKEFAGELAKGIIVPQGIQWLAGLSDKDAQGEKIRRQPETILENIKTGIPGLRSSVPIKKNKKQSDWMKYL
jgi:hypothetical protein